MTTSGAGGPMPPEGGTARAGSPTCYRHPGRETYIRCQRCDRPICPDCMRQASVGFQCPDCVAEGNRGRRPARTVFGGRVSTGDGVVTKTLIGLSVVAYLAQLTVPGFTERFAQIGLARGSNAEVIGVAHGEWYRLLTAAFLHDQGNFTHILFNMLALWWLGPQLEQAFGRVRFLALYLLSALGGSALAYVVSPPNQPFVGASTAVFGLFGATFVMSRRLRLDATWVLGLIAINLALGFFIPNIGVSGHIGGLIAGTLVATAFAVAPRGRPDLARWVGWGGCAAVLLVEVAATIARSSQLLP